MSELVDEAQVGAWTDGDPFLLVIEGNPGRRNLGEWIQANCAFIEEKLLEHSAILLRDFDAGVPDFEMVGVEFAAPALDYFGGTSPRQKFKGKVYNSTNYPSAWRLPQHNELAYRSTWPMRLLFHCDIAPALGGETTIGSSRTLMKRLDPKLVKVFEERRVKYLQRMGPGCTRTWQHAFETQDVTEAERRCRAVGLEFEWSHGGDMMTTKTVCQGVSRHPKTAERFWFNQAHSLSGCVIKNFNRDYAATDKDPAELDKFVCTYETYFGDGSPLEQSMLEEILGAFEETQIAFTWKKGDILILDNMLASHGRNPFEGSRLILAWLGKPHTHGERALSVP